MPDKGNSRVYNLTAGQPVPFHENTDTSVTTIAGEPFQNEAEVPSQEDLDVFSKGFKLLREELGLSHRQVAKELEALGDWVSYSTISRFEKGHLHQKCSVGTYRILKKWCSRISSNSKTSIETSEHVTSDLSLSDAKDPTDEVLDAFIRGFKELRKELGFSQRWVAERLQAAGEGIPLSAIKSFECGDLRRTYKLYIYHVLKTWCKEIGRNKLPIPPGDNSPAASFEVDNRELSPNDPNPPPMTF